MIISNSHGNPTYGEKGAVGNKGADAPSIYYTPYDSSVDYESIIEIINSSNGRSLSNNPNYDGSINYEENDVIIDSYGCVSIIFHNSSFHGKDIMNIGQIIPKMKKTTSLFNDCSAYFITSAENNFTIDNIYNYLGPDCSSNFIHHRDTHRDKTPIEKIQIDSDDIFEIVKTESDAIDIHFIILFPDGFIFEKKLDKLESNYSENVTYLIDVDCRYMYERVKKDSDYYTNISSIDDEYTYNANRSLKLQNFIKNECKSYIEFTINDTQYRIKVNYN